MDVPEERIDNEEPVEEDPIVEESPEPEPVVEADPEPEEEKTVSKVNKTPKTKQDLQELVKYIKPSLLKVYKLESFPTNPMEALSPQRLVDGINHVNKSANLDPKNEMVQQAASLAWHRLFDEKKVGSTSFYRPLEVKESLPF